MAHSDLHTSNPFFSVIITSYNREGLIIRALDSLINQEFSDWEALIVDDGSTDNTFAAIQAYVEKDSRITFIARQHEGNVSSLNFGFKKAKGHYITLLDSDDEYLPRHLQSRWEILHQNPEIELLHGGVQIIGSPYVPNRFNTLEQIHLTDCIIGGTFFFSQDLCTRLHGFSPIPYGSDSDFFERAVQLNSKIVKTQIASYVYHRENPDSLTNQAKV